MGADRHLGGPTTGRRRRGRPPRVGAVVTLVFLVGAVLTGLPSPRRASAAPLPAPAPTVGAATNTATPADGRVGFETVARSPINRPTAIVSGNDGALWLANGGGSLGRLVPGGAPTDLVDPAVALPSALTTDPGGTVWFVDRAHHAIDRITPTGTVELVAQVGTSDPFNGGSFPKLLAPGADGSIWYTIDACAGGGCVSWPARIAADGTPADDLTYQLIEVANPRAIVTTADGRLWFVDSQGGVGVLAVDGTVAGYSDPDFAVPATAMAIGPDGDVWVAGPGHVAHVASDGTFTVRADVAIGTPRALAAGPDDALWFTNDDNRIGSVAGNGTVTTFTDAELVEPRALTAGPDGNLWFTNDAHSIGSITPTGTVTVVHDPGVLDPAGRSGAPTSVLGALTIGPGGDLWFPTGEGAGRLAQDGALDVFTDPDLAGATSFATGADGNLWFTDSVGGAIGRRTADGTVTRFTGPDIFHPFGIVAGPDDALWFLASGRRTVVRIGLDGTVTAISDPAIAFPTAMTLGSDGNLWLANSACHPVTMVCNDSIQSSIARVTPAGTVTTFAGGPYAPVDIVTGEDGNVWFLDAPCGSPGACFGTSHVGRLAPDGSDLQLFALPASMWPTSIDEGYDGNIWLTARQVGNPADPDPSFTVFATDGTTTRVTPPDGMGTSRVTTSTDGTMWFAGRGGRIHRLTGRGAASGFEAVSPFRLVDSRVGIGLPGPIGDGGTGRVPVAGVGGIPTDATAVVMNVTVTGGTSASYLTVTPEPPLPSVTANVVFAPGQTTPDLVTSALGPDGAVAFVNQHGSVDVVADVVGWYGPTSPTGFTPMTPARLLDSRTTDGGWPGPLGPGEARDLDVAGIAGIPAEATAVALNVTVTEPTAASYLRVTPAGSAPSGTANLLFAPGQTVPNAVTVGVGAPGDPVRAGRITILNQLGTVDVIVDVVGWFAPGTGERFHAALPHRVVDTRTPAGAGPLGPGDVRTTAVTDASPAAVPVTATAVAATVTVTGATAASYLTVAPGGTTPPGGAPTANLLFAAGQTVPNHVTTGLGTADHAGTIDLYNQYGSVDAIVDVAGWYGP